MSTDTRPADAARAPEDARYDTGDTIAAIATPPGPGAVGIVRISGQDAFAAGMAMFRAAGPPASEPPPSHLLTYGHIVDPASDEPIDEVLVAFMRAPRTEVDGLLAGADRGQLLREGLRVALVGRPNVGKSSLLNALLRTERAIVTPVAGTTRDTVEEWASVGGVPLHLIDTAGLSPSDDPIERLGVERSRAAAQSADLLLFVVDASCPLTPLDFQAAAQLRAMRAEADSPAAAGAHELVLVLNKADLPQIVDEAQVRELWRGAALAHTCPLSGEGIAAREDAITRKALGGETQAGEVLVSSARHQDALRRAGALLAAAEQPPDGVH